MSNNVRCEKDWKPAFQVPCGTVIIVYPLDKTTGTNEKLIFNLCVKHIEILRAWVKGNAIKKLPREIPDEQMKLPKELTEFMVNPQQ